MLFLVDSGTAEAAVAMILLNLAPVHLEAAKGERAIVFEEDKLFVGLYWNTDIVCMKGEE